MGSISVKKSFLETTVIPKNERIEAQKRRKLKRYLAVLGCVIPVEIPTSALRAFVKALHAKRMKDGRLNYAWPLTQKQAEERAKASHYVNQLFAMKAMFGNHAKVGFVVEGGKTVHCGTIQEMIDNDCVPPRYRYLDHYLSSVALIRHNGVVLSLGN